jgi:hypothetical protein
VLGESLPYIGCPPSAWAWLSLMACVSSGTVRGVAGKGSVVLEVAVPYLPWHREAQLVLERAAELFHRHGDQADEAKCWQLLGDVSRRNGAAAAAQSHFERALRLWRSVGDAQRVSEAVSALAVVSG